MFNWRYLNWMRLCAYCLQSLTLFWAWCRLITTLCSEHGTYSFLAHLEGISFECLYCHPPFPAPRQLIARPLYYLCMKCFFILRAVSCSTLDALKHSVCSCSGGGARATLLAASSVAPARDSCTLLYFKKLPLHTNWPAHAPLRCWHFPWRTVSPLCWTKHAPSPLASCLGFCGRECLTCTWCLCLSSHPLQ